VREGGREGGRKGRGRPDEEQERSCCTIVRREGGREGRKERKGEGEEDRHDKQLMNQNYTQGVSVH
jgi:hypothetical protein